MEDQLPGDITPLALEERCKLVVLGLEVGGRCSQEATFFIELLAQHKARQAPPILQHSITTALIARWSALLTHAVQQHRRQWTNFQPTSCGSTPPNPLSQPAPTTVSTHVPKSFFFSALPKLHLATGQYKTVSSQQGELDLMRKKVRRKKNAGVDIEAQCWWKRPGQCPRSVRSSPTAGWPFERQWHWVVSWFCNGYIAWSLCVL